jgi:predicted chitinase
MRESVFAERIVQNTLDTDFYYFWLSNHLFAEADKGANSATVDAITKIINEATDSYAKRRDNFERIFEHEKIFKDI